MTSACSPRELPQRPVNIYAVPLTDGTQCIAIDDSSAAAVLVCDNEPMPRQESAADWLARHKL